MPIVDPATALSLPSLPALPNPSAALQSVLASFPSPDAAQATAVVIPGAPTVTTPNTPIPAPSDNPLISWLQKIGNTAFQTGGIGVTGQPTTPTGNPTFSFGRVAAFILGIIFIGIGLFMFKPAQQIVARTIRTTTL